jgi:hypothetical protein
MMKWLGVAAAAVLFGCGPGGPPFKAGFSAVAITPSGFEGFLDRGGDGLFQTKVYQHNGGTYPPDVFLDTGRDGLFSFQEPGALGPDGKPGIAGVDDDGDGEVDDLLGCGDPADDPSDPRTQGCEYLAPGSDDVADPNGDDYHPDTNPTGTERDGRWQKVVIAGYGGALTGDPIRPARFVADDLWARALVVQKGEQVFALIATDLVGFLHIYGNPVKRRIAERTGIPYDSIVYMANHNHDGPDVVGIWAGPSDLDYEYLAQVEEAMVRAVEQAHAQLTPAVMKAGSAYVEGCYEQSTLRRKPGPDCHLPVSLRELSANPDAYDVPINQIDLRDPMVFNHKVTALMFTEEGSGRTLGTVVNFHDHPEVMLSRSNHLSSDFPHYVRRGMEERYGGVALYVSGTTGSQIGTLRSTLVPLYDEAGQPVLDPDGRIDADGKPFPAFTRGDTPDPAGQPPFEKTRSLGFVVADVAIRALEGAQVSKDPKVEVKASSVDIPFSNPELGIAMAAIQTEAKKRGYLKHRDDVPITADYCPENLGQRSCARITVAVVTVGDVTFITSPGEPSPEYLLGRGASQVDFGPPWGVHAYPAMPRLLDYVPTREVMMLAISNGYFGYQLPEADFLYDANHPNHYEELPSAGHLFGDTVGNKWLQLLGAPEGVSFNPNAPVRP